MSNLIRIYVERRAGGLRFFASDIVPGGTVLFEPSPESVVTISFPPDANPFPPEYETIELQPGGDPTPAPVRDDAKDGEYPFEVAFGSAANDKELGTLVVSSGDDSVSKLGFLFVSPATSYLQIFVPLGEGAVGAELVQTFQGSQRLNLSPRGREDFEVQFTRQGAISPFLVSTETAGRAMALTASSGNRAVPVEDLPGEGRGPRGRGERGSRVILQSGGTTHVDIIIDP